ncbi:glycosyl hydrolase family 18 protein, partial [Streptacidiphilus neutrinimicus]|uniref:glycosyl hydrolase family 18 protein n=1 Tax=Streptacidiphilus neutrinimicus TaxID=105420 RepID=UPI0013786EB4
MPRSRRFGLTLAGAATAVLGLAASLLGAPASAAAAGNTTGAAATSGGIKVAYFDQWSIYQNAFYLKNLDTEGIAGKLNYLIYDFENIDPSNLTCFETTKATDPDPAGENDPNAGDGAGDSFADYQKSFDSSISVDGTSDVYNQPIAGNFHQLQELKKKYPNLKILLSIGGWTYSKYFSDVAATAASRQKFVSSCIDMFIKGNLPSQGGYGGTGTGAGIFDGFDIDWEYPGAAGHLGNHYSAADTANYTALLAEFRSELSAQGAADGHTYALSAAVPSGQDKISKIQTNQIGQYLNFADAMTYDMYGAWNATGPTDEQDPLYANPNSPESKIAPGNETYSIDNAIRAWTVGDSAYGIPGGFPANKLTVGIPFYYRGWTGVPAGSNHGLYQTATGGSPGQTDSGDVPGVAMYKELSGVVNNASDTFWDPVTDSAYFYDGNNFYGGESSQSIQARADYAHCHGLAGFMMFSLYDLDPAATLFNAAVNDISGSAGSCPTGGGSETVSVTNPGNQTGTVGTAASVQVSGSDSAGKSLTFTATGLPAGLSISSSGLVSGTPTTAGTSNVTVTASSGTASGSTSFTWTVNSSGGGSETVSVTNPGNQTGTVGTAASVQVSGSDSAGKSLTFTATGLPAGLSISSSGLVSGTPTTAGTSNVTVTASSGTASGSTSFTWTVNASGGSGALTNGGFESGSLSPWT